MRFPRSTVLPFVLLALSTPATAQRTSTFVGVVRVDSTNVPVVGAQIAINRTRIQTLSDSAGRFYIGNVPSGRQIVTVRRIGFQAVITVLDFTPGDTLDGEIGLSIAATPLPEVDVVARDLSKIKLEGFERRRSSGFGSFIGPEVFEKGPSRVTADIIMQIPGPHLVRSTNTGATWVAGGRMAINSGNVAVTAADRRRGASDRNCYATVYLDGSPVYSALPGEMLFDINSVPANQLAAIEYFAGSAQAPPEYPQRRNTCGVIILWTKVS